MQIDKTAPIINITSPSPEDNSAHDFGASLTFHINDTDLSGTAGCNLTLDNVDYVMSQIASWNKTLSFNTAGQSFWNVTCIDAVGNQRTSLTRSFTILSNFTNIGGFSGSTDLTAVENITNVYYFFVENIEGSINFSGSIDFSSGFDWSKFINISDNLIDVNSTGAPLLNTSAIITVYNISWTTPRILKNGVECVSPQCNILSYNTTSGTLVFNVTSFSIYSTEDAYVPAAPAAGGSGGGSGMYIPPKSVNNSTTEETNTEDNEDNSETTSEGLGITGAVIGGTAKALWIAGGFIAIVAVLLVIVFLRRKANSSNPAGKILVDTSVQTV